MASRCNAATAQASAMAAAAVRSVELGFSDVLKMTSDETLLQQQKLEEAMHSQELERQQRLALQRERAEQAFADKREELRQRSGFEPGSLEWILGSRLTSCRTQEPITEDWLEDLSARVDMRQPDRSTKKKLEKSRQPQEEISLDQDHYYVLGLATDAPEEEVRQAHRSLAHLYRPVETGDAERREERRRKLQAVHEAYHVLSSLERRAAYDAAVAARAAQQASAAPAAPAAQPTASSTKQPNATPTMEPSVKSAVESKKAEPTAHPTGDPSAETAEAAEPRNDFDFTGDGRPFRLALGDAGRVCAGIDHADGIRRARAQLRGRAPLELIERGGLLHPADASSPFGALGERPLPAELRRGVCELVLARTRASPRRGLRYASLGSSRALLFDLELLERLRCAGVHVAQVCLVDRAFLHPTESTQRALQQFADWNRAVAAAPDLRHAPAEVLTFGRLVDFHESARSKGCDLLLSVGAEWRGALSDCKRLATRALAPDGLLARLGPDERAQHAGLFEAFAGDVEQPRAVESCVASAWTLITWPAQSLRPPSLQPLEDPRLSPLQRAEGEHWRVVFAPRVAVRARPEGSAKVVDVLYPPDEVVVAGRQGPWLRLASWPGSGEKPAEAWVLSDGSELGLGTLLERVDGGGEAAQA